MQTTPNYNLKKIELTDAPPDITVLNANADITDTEIKKMNNRVDSVKVDISLLQTFDFDNLSSFPGCTLTSTKTVNSYTDTITLTATGKNVADRTETKTDTAYITVIRVYKDDGLTVDKTINIAETRIAEGYKTVIS